MPGSLQVRNHFDCSPQKGTFLKFFTTEVHGQTDFVKPAQARGDPNPSELLRDGYVNPYLQLALPVPNDH